MSGRQATCEAGDGAYVSNLVNVTPATTATQGVLDTIEKRDPAYTGGIPDLGLYGSYLSAGPAVAPALLP